MLIINIEFTIYNSQYFTVALNFLQGGPQSPDILDIILLKDEIFLKANQKYEANRSEQIQAIIFGNPFSLQTYEA